MIYYLLTSHCLITIRRNLVPTWISQLLLRSEFGCSLCDLHFWITSALLYHAMPFNSIMWSEFRTKKQLTVDSLGSWLHLDSAMGNSIPAIAGRISLKKSRSWPHRFFVARADSDKRNCYILTWMYFLIKNFLLNSVNLVNSIPLFGNYFELSW